MGNSTQDQGHSRINCKLLSSIGIQLIKSYTDAKIINLGHRLGSRDNNDDLRAEEPSEQDSMKKYWCIKYHFSKFSKSPRFPCLPGSSRAADTPLSGVGKLPSSNIAPSTPHSLLISHHDHSSLDPDLGRARQSIRNSLRRQNRHPRH